MKKKPSTKKVQRKRAVKKKASTSTSSQTRKKATTRSTSKKAPSKQASSKPSSEKRLSLLNAAVEILKAERRPMQCKEIVEKALAKGIWFTTGKTPHATLYSSILREIQIKGSEARFRKVKRGHFALRGASK